MLVARLSGSELVGANLHGHGRTWGVDFVRSFVQLENGGMVVIRVIGDDAELFMVGCGWVTPMVRDGRWCEWR